MKTPRLLLSICTLAIGLALQSAAWGYSVTAATQFTWSQSSWTEVYTYSGGDTTPGSIVPGASGAGSTLPGPGNAARIQVLSSNFDVYGSAAAVQDYAVFYARASLQAQVYQVINASPDWLPHFQISATGKFIETLTISGPGGMGGTGQLMLGWDVTGSCLSGPSGDAFLSISAQTPGGTFTQTPSITSNGHYFLLTPISFTFGTPFELTVTSEVFADFHFPTATGSYGSVANFLQAVILSSVGVSDSAGTPLANFTIITDEGWELFPMPPPFSASTVPIPSAVLLLGSGLLRLAAYRRKLRKG